MKYVILNHGTNNPNYESDVKAFEATIGACREEDVDGLDYVAFLKGLQPSDEVYLMGGDGTLNWFINGLGDYEPTLPVYLYPAGTGNDFIHDVLGQVERKPVLINEYIKNLPVVEVTQAGNEGSKICKKFINGIGYGIDGYCCEMGDKLKEEGKKVDYTAIAIKGLLFHFKKVTATVSVDGKQERFRDVWLAPSMKGRFYGGGMMVAPAQNRAEEALSLVVFRGKSKLHTLMVFPSIFKGEHVKHEKMVFVRRGKEIEVSFDRPTALQIDGETVLNVTSYRVKA